MTRISGEGVVDRSCPRSREVREGVKGRVIS